MRFILLKSTSLFFIFLMVLLVNVANAQVDCVTSECHAEIGTKQFIHGPVGAGICVVCHNPVEGKDHEFTYVADKEELCFSCHEDKRDMMLEDNVHTPVAEGNCIGCHDPHQTDYRYTLKGQAADLCYNCHGQEEFTKQFVHGPVGVGDCNVCHNPHSSPNPKQLLLAKDQLCLSCHKEKTDIMNKRHIHKPVEDDCTNCHDPHSNNANFLLPADPPDLCYGCHSEIATMASASHRHEPVQTGQCNKCHDSHASDNPRMYPASLTETCYSCHEELGTFIGNQEFKHGPVKEGDCNACHNPHGSENHRLLKKDFPDEFYIPYSTENYAICFDCHNKDIALDQKTLTLTDFRDDDRNLHFLHVNKDPKGRSCKACHQVHASSQQKHIRTSVPYGKIKWELPVTFTKFEDGGKCVVGCHSPKEYHRK